MACHRAVYPRSRTLTRQSRTLPALALTGRPSPLSWANRKPVAVRALPLLTDGVDKVGDLREGSVYSLWRLELARFLAASETSGDTDLSDQRSGLSLTQTIRPVCAAAGARNSWRVS